MKVIIIGAGIGGLSAAQTLEGSADYIVLEARDRIGGRIHTMQPKECPGTTIDLGASWLKDVPENDLESFAEDAGVEFVFDDDATQMYGPKGVLDRVDVGRIGAELASFCKVNPEMSMRQALERFNSIKIDENEKYIAKCVAQTHQLDYGLGLPDLSSHEWLKNGRSKANIGGMAQVLEAAVKGVDKSKIHLNNPVHTISVTETGVEVETAKGKFVADYAIVAVPIGVLNSGGIKLPYDLPPPLVNAIHTTVTAQFGRIYMEFPEVFWPMDAKKFVVSTETPAIVWNWHKVYGGRKILCLLVCNRVIVAAEARPAEAFELVKHYLEIIAPGKTIPKPLWTVVTSWLTDVYTKGAFSAYKIGSDRAKAVEAFEAGADPIFFAGEHTVLKGATLIQGAYASGRRAAQQVLRR